MKFKSQPNFTSHQTEISIMPYKLILIYQTLLLDGDIIV